MMNNFDSWFPEVIGCYFNNDHKKYEHDLIKRCSEIKDTNKINGGDKWVSNVFNTNQTVDITKEEVFKPILNFQQRCVKTYSNELQMTYMNNMYNPKLYGTWFNTYLKNDFQEYHTHESILSTIYCISCDDKDARTIFKSHRYEMYPIGYNTDSRPVGRAYYEPVPGKLLVFRSHLEHCVEQKTTEKPRITLASNYI